MTCTTLSPNPPLIQTLPAPSIAAACGAVTTRPPAAYGVDVPFVTCTTPRLPLVALATHTLPDESTATALVPPARTSDGTATLVALKLLPLFTSSVSPLETPLVGEFAAHTLPNGSSATPTGPARPP